MTRSASSASVRTPADGPGKLDALLTEDGVMFERPS
jgi:hypothetical protein